MRLAGQWKVILILFLVLLAGGIFVGSLRVEKVNISGNEYYSAAEAEDLIFSEEWERNPLVIWFSEKLGKEKEIPFIEKYQIHLNGFSSADVTIYEKNMVGYVEFLGSCLYFDRDGMVVESSAEHYGDVPLVTGLDVDYVVLSEPLPVSDKSVFQMLLTLTQHLSSRSITWAGEEQPMIQLIDRIHFDSMGNVSCYVEDVVVSLGSGDSLEGKLQEMTDILPELEGRSGTLHLETYDETLTNPSYIFKNQK